MRLQYRITEQDYVAAGMLCMRKRTRWSRTQLWLWPVVGGLVMLSGLAQIVESSRWIAQAALIAWGALIAAIPLIYRQQMKRTYRRQPLFHEIWTMELTDSDVFIGCSQADSRLNWRRISRFAEDDRCTILFQQGERFFYILPTPTFTSEQRAELRAILIAHLGEPK